MLVIKKNIGKEWTKWMKSLTPWSVLNCFLFTFWPNSPDFFISPICHDNTMTDGILNQSIHIINIDFIQINTTDKLAYFDEKKRFVTSILIYIVIKLDLTIFLPFFQKIPCRFSFSSFAQYVTALRISHDASHLHSRFECYL